MLEAKICFRKFHDYWCLWVCKLKVLTTKKMQNFENCVHVLFCEIFRVSWEIFILFSPTVVQLLLIIQTYFTFNLRRVTQLWLVICHKNDSNICDKVKTVKYPLRSKTVVISGLNWYVWFIIISNECNLSNYYKLF